MRPNLCVVGALRSGRVLIDKSKSKKAKLASTLDQAQRRPRHAPGRARI